MATALQTLFANPTMTNAQLLAAMAEEGVLLVDPADVPDLDLSLEPYPAVIDPETGDFFSYDSTDTTSAHDGATVLVCGAGRRYKMVTTFRPDGFVISAGDETPPGSPSIGDQYIIGAAPTGAWASKAKNIASYTARGWIFTAPRRGLIAWVNDENTFFHYASTDAWVEGLPIEAITTGTLTPDKFKHPLALLAVEDTRNDPPGSVPADGTAYVVGASPTGAFAGEAGNVAYVKAGAYIFFDAFEGATVYSKEIGSDLVYKSGAWTRKVEASVVPRAYRANVTGVSLGSMSSGVREEVGNFTVQAQSSSSWWRIEVERLTVTKSGGSGGSTYTWRLYLDSESSSTETFLLDYSAATYDSTDVNTPANGAPLIFTIQAPDAAAHVFRINLSATDTLGATFSNAGYRIWVTEIVPST